MKKEILRIHNFNKVHSGAIKLINISMSLIEGESIGFLGLVNSGKNLLVDILCEGQNTNQTGFYIGRKEITNMAEIKKIVYRIMSSNYLIDNWTVAEYISLDPSSFILGIDRPKKLAIETESLLQQLALNINVNSKLKDLSELEKRLIDLVKAYSEEKKILVIEDEFEGCSTQDIKQFKEVLNRVIHSKMVVIINSHSNNVSYILSDKYMIFKKGHIVKKCRKEYIKSDNHLEKFLVGTTITQKKQTFNRYKNRQSYTKQINYTIKSIKSKENYDFNFNKSEVVTMLILDVKVKKEIFNLLSGRYIDKNITIYLEEKECKFTDITDFVKNKIVSIADMGGEDELLLSMSVGDNLLIASLDKISSLHYMLLKQKMLNMLEKEVKNNIVETGESIKAMSINEHIVILLERWYIYKPKVLILFEPFVNCDIYGVSLVKSYIKKFTDLGTTVIIIKSREEYVVDISDCIIHIK